MRKMRNILRILRRAFFLTAIFRMDKITLGIRETVKSEVYMSIRVGILGYGNLGRGIELGIRQNPDMELVAVFTRRAPETLKLQT